MTNFISDRVTVRVPEWVSDYDSFCRWADSEDYPEVRRIYFLDGEVWVDTSMEELFSHNQVRVAIDYTLYGLVRDGDLGIYMTDGMLMTNPEARIGTEPDGMFVSSAAFADGRARFTAGRKRGAQATRLVGTPDMVVEVVSESSEDKDTERQMSAYADAGIREYWLIDARGEDLRFDVFKLGAKGYTATRRQGGWLKSAVFGRSFRLVRKIRENGWHSYRLEMR